MEWHDEGIVLATRRHGETSMIVEAMTRRHGRHLGLVRGGRSRRLQPVLQPGNRVDLVWRARLDEHIGAFVAEPVELNTARLFGNAVALLGLQTLAAHLRLLPERDPHLALYDVLALMLRHLDESAIAAELVVRFELLLLEELGFGLDLSRCAATGAKENLEFVSPKSGRAICRTAGEPWRERMLPLPQFLLRADIRPGISHIDQAFFLTGFFLERHVYEPRGLGWPEARDGFLAALRKVLQEPLAEEKSPM